MTVAVNSQKGHGMLVIDVAGEAAAAKCLGSIANPEGVDLLITEAFLYIVTPAGLASTLHVGVGAEGVDSHDLNDGCLLNGTAGTCWSGMHPVAADAEMSTPAYWTAETFLNFTTAAQVSTSFVGKYFVEYARLED
jgi:hypothetical protein